MVESSSQVIYTTKQDRLEAIKGACKDKAMACLEQNAEALFEPKAIHDSSDWLALKPSKG